MGILSRSKANSTWLQSFERSPLAKFKLKNGDNLAEDQTTLSANEPLKSSPDKSSEVEKEFYP